MTILLSAVFLVWILLHEGAAAPTGKGTSSSASGLGPCEKPDSRPAACEDFSILGCSNGTYIQVCNWATMQVMEVKCIYNHFAKRCQPSRKWDMYVSRTPCEVHKGKTTCEQAISPESLHYATHRTCQWTTVTSRSDTPHGMCRSPPSAFFYLLTSDSLIFRVDPYQKQLQYVREEDSITAIAPDANTMTGMFLAKHDKSKLKLMYLSNIERDMSTLEDLNVDFPHNSRHAGLGVNVDGSILTAVNQSISLCSYKPDRPRGNRFSEQPIGCSQRFSGDLAGRPRSKHSTPDDNQIYMLSEGMLVQTLRCVPYDRLVDQRLTALAFTCNGELYAGTDNSIYRILFDNRYNPVAAEEIISLNSHTIRDFSSQPGCNLQLSNPKRRR